MENTEVTAVAPVKRQKGGISSVIDELLLEGGRTISEVAALVNERVGSLSKNKQSVSGNVRVRMTLLRKRGYTFERDAEGKVKAVKAA